jgi:tetratricopeptide (TPR) repeat protein
VFLDAAAALLESGGMKPDGFVLRGLDEVAMVGRGEALAGLDAALVQAVQSRAPQTVTLLGSAGLGKTRLCREWAARVRATAPAFEAGPAVRILEVRAAGAEPASELPELIGEILRARFGLQGLAGDEALQRFRAELQRVFGDRRIAEVAALVGSFLGFEMPESPLLRALARKPRQGIDLSRAVLGRFLEQDAALAPLVLVIDDLHQADDRSIDILQDLAAELGEAPILIVAAARPDIFLRRPDWGSGGGHHRRIDVGPLPRPALASLIRAMLSDDDIVPGLVDRAAEESAGSPFLLEQLLRVYRQHGILTLGAAAGQGWWIDLERAERKRMTVTPEEAAQRRVTALSPAERDILARGAAFGDSFWTGGVVALGRLGAEAAPAVPAFTADAAAAEARSALEALEARGYLTRVAPGAPAPLVDGETTWAFRHPVERQLVAAAVDPPLMRRRRAAAAQWLESRAGDATAARFERLGHLYQEAGDSRRAGYCFIAAGGDARARLQLDPARRLYLRGIALLGLDDAAAKMDALHAAGDLCARLGRTREAIACFQDMLRLAWRLDLPAKGGAAHDRLGRLHGLIGEHKAALAHLGEARALFEAAGDLRGIAAALDDIGRLQLLGGAPEASLAHHRAALALRERLGDDRGRALALSRIGEAEHDLGHLDEAGACFRQALELRRRAGDRQGQVSSLLDLGGLERDLGRLDRALAVLEEGRALARELGERLYECSLGIAIGDCRLAAGEPQAALAELGGAHEIARRFGARLLTCEAMRGLAEAELALGDAVRARDQARAAFELAEAIGAPQLAGAALRVAADCVGQGAPGEAELGGAREMFDRAVELLRNAGAELELCRTLAAYAAFEERIGRRDAAAELRRQARLAGTRAADHAPRARSARGAHAPAAAEA